ncbi:sphingosine-1-phosphate phosphatase 2-like isoform X2 [Centruroides sculpturatus]|uniref:sphingosine-1-phosphate phosphatase 2-like isoform X2 n=1 Tax=Centruroides sculpturatus TaxID=218467 RepID=UPI000C6E5A6B|nr:sphingosine-1-phosphate phosphatase 2-like isoform X2 [Centruroides sculpturatus]
MPWIRRSYLRSDEMGTLGKLKNGVLEYMEKLKDPYIVSNFQNFFGVYRIDVKRNGYDSKGNSSGSHHLLNKRKVKTKLNGNFNICTENFEEEVIQNNNSCNSDDAEVSDIEPEIGRRVVLVWVIVMYVGQALKDVIRWLRPSSPPVVHLEPEYVKEYGMPSTHAMLAAAVPFSLLIFTMHRYEYQFAVGLFICSVCCLLVCISRLYMGMHTVLDIIGGLVLVSLLMIIVVPLVDYIDHFQLTCVYSPLVILSASVAMAILYPKSDRRSPARGDTTIILGTGAGIYLGAWLNFQLGIIRGPGLPPPYQIIWPDYTLVGLALLRASIGILCVVASRAFFKSLSYAIVCYILRLDPNALETKQKTVVEMSYKFITYTTIGIMITYISPIVFRFLNIERITMFTEV